MHAREVQVIADDHQVAGGPARLEPARGVRDEHAGDAEPRHGPHAVHDLPERVALVDVHAALHADDRYVVDVTEAEVAGVPDHLRRGQVGERLVGNLDELGQAVGERAEPAAEDDADARNEADLRADRFYGLVETFRDTGLGVAHGGDQDIMTSWLPVR